MKDNVGGITGYTKGGAVISSDDGIKGWKVVEPALAYDHNIAWNDGTSLHADRRERPSLLIENGKATCLFTSIESGKKSRNRPVPIKPAYSAVVSEMQ